MGTLYNAQEHCSALTILALFRALLYRRTQERRCSNRAIIMFMQNWSIARQVRALKHGSVAIQDEGIAALRAQLLKGSVQITTEVIRQLDPLLKDRDDKVRWNAISVLVDLGSRDEGRLPSNVQTILVDADGTVRFDLTWPAPKEHEPTYKSCEFCGAECAYKGDKPTEPCWGPVRIADENSEVHACEGHEWIWSNMYFKGYVREGETWPRPTHLIDVDVYGANKGKYELIEDLHDGRVRVAAPVEQSQ